MSDAPDTNKGNPANSKALAAVVTIFENDHFIVLNKPGVFHNGAVHATSF